MKTIVFKNAEGLLCVLRPVEGARLVKRVRFANEDYVYEEPRPADSVQRKWPDPDVQVLEWAETEAAFVARIAAKDLPETATDVTALDDADLPADRVFRDAWRITGGAVAVDMPAAREIYRTQLRQIRAPLLAALDVAFIRTLETGDVVEQAAVIARKQALRAVTEDPAIDAAQTPEQLKAVIPAALR